MTASEWTFAALLAMSAGLVTAGCALAWVPLGFIVGGVLLAVWAWFVLAESGPTAGTVAAPVAVEGDL